MYPLFGVLGNVLQNPAVDSGPHSRPANDLFLPPGPPPDIEKRENTKAHRKAPPQPPNVVSNTYNFIGFTLESIKEYTSLTQQFPKNRAMAPYTCGERDDEN